MAATLIAAVQLIIPGPGAAGAVGAGPVVTPSAPAPSVHVEGNRLVDSAGSRVRLVGVNVSGTEWMCPNSWGIFFAPTDSASIKAIRSWHANSVRLPLNEDCWLGLNGLDTSMTGRAFRTAFVAYVHSLEQHGLNVILDLHWSRAGTTVAIGQDYMANTDHSLDFWRSVARTFKGDNAVIFELFNEPHDISWSCWRTGCTLPDGSEAAGMQQMLRVVRRTGATNVVLVSGLNWANDLTGWLAGRPIDPANQLGAVFHTYPWNACVDAACWDATVLPVAKEVPVVTTEFGTDVCDGTYAASFMDWADARRVSYLAWNWDVLDGGCDVTPTLISDWSGTPTAYGQVVRAHFLQR